MDRTYLLEAERLGAEVRPGALVSHVRPHLAGYEVFYRNIGSGRRDTVIARRLVLAAGTLGTTEILLRSRHETATLPGSVTTWGEDSPPMATSWARCMAPSATSTRPSDQT